MPIREGLDCTNTRRRPDDSQNDFGDAFGREGEDRRYFDRFAREGYGFGVNVYLYAMTH